MKINNNVSTGIKWGLILGVIYCAFLYVRWNNAANTYAYVVLAVINFLLILGLLFFEASQRKKRDGGFIELKDLFQTLFISVLILELFYAIFNMVYLRWTNPGVIDKMHKAMEVMLDKMGKSITEEQKKESLQNIDQLRASVETGNVIKGYFTSVAVTGVLSFFIALIMRKKKPENAETNI